MILCRICCSCMPLHLQTGHTEMLHVPADKIKNKKVQNNIQRFHFRVWTAVLEQQTTGITSFSKLCKQQKSWRILLNIKIVDSVSFGAEWFVMLPLALRCTEYEQTHCKICISYITTHSALNRYFQLSSRPHSCFKWTIPHKVAVTQHFHHSPRNQHSNHVTVKLLSIRIQRIFSDTLHLQLLVHYTHY